MVVIIPSLSPSLPPSLILVQGIPFGKVMVCAIPIALLTYLESVSVGRKYALFNKYALGTYVCSAA